MEIQNSGDLNREQESSYPGIRFEPWSHRVEGEPGHDTEVISRLRQYNPQVVAIDGDTPGIAGAGYSDILFNPHPSAVNSKDDLLYVVRGDMNYGDFPGIAQRNTPRLWNENKDGFEAMYSKQQEVGRWSEQELRQDFYEQQKKAETFAALIFGLSTVSGIALLNTQLTRRKLLASLAQAGAAVATAERTPLLDFFLTDQEALTPNETVKDILDQVSVVLPKFKRNWWVNGRTALITAKILDGIDAMHKPRNTPAAVVIGRDHTYNSKQYLYSSHARQEAIHSLAKNSLDVCKEVFRTYGMPAQQEAVANNLFLDYLALEEVVSYPLRKTEPLPTREALIFSPQVLLATTDLRMVGQSDGIERQSMPHAKTRRQVLPKPTTRLLQ